MSVPDASHNRPSEGREGFSAGLSCVWDCLVGSVKKKVIRLIYKFNCKYMEGVKSQILRRKMIPSGAVWQKNGQ